MPEDSVDRHVAHWARELDPFDPVKEAIVMRLAFLGRHLARTRREALDSDGLRHGEFKMLLTLRRQGPPYTASPSRLADLLGLTRGALSSRLGPLEQAGLITRATDATDRRRVHVQLTEAGHEALRRHLDSEGRGEDDLLSVLADDERQALAGLLRKLVVGVESGPGAA
ncbi:MarR family winged helix-turn-helix transcriptional regulator [Streptomyces sp. NPDC058301]|uniref:MarR family winged helix-turn-helix transcriptional regulator n=1 Tax=Streptomyces sp. NPDC058301 TaxID=3346436 RepID=UPI0036E1251D